jgi:hypothetical protein
MIALVAVSLTVAGLASAGAPQSGNKIECFGDCVQLSPNRAEFRQGGVFIPGQPGGQLISSVSKLSFQYSGSGAAPGAPRFSIPINTNGDGNTTAYFAFADVFSCNNGSTSSGTLDVTGDSTCLIYADTETFPNWAAFVTAHPDYRIANNDYTFIISDSGSPDYTVSNVQILAKSRGGGK